MANSGFKGSIVSLSGVEIVGTDEAAAIKTRVHFCNSQGIVHAVTAHNIALTKEDTPDLYDAAANLVRLLKEHIATLHFTEPDGAATPVQKEQVIRGIGEALRNSVDTADGVGTQG